ncbi:hypothetical protein WG908_00180 [Sphingobium sp. AN641]|uniref:hypothetical protein n=1 Tax=Sphingobium sp. AN641 TaxID=3133443 RepID=UPI0030C2EB01
MDLIFAVLDVFGLLIPPKEERDRRWHRLGCFVTLAFALFFAIIGSIIWLWGSL